MNLDCDINPARIADAAVKMANTYRQYRNDRARQVPSRSGSKIKRKRTKINIERDYEQTKASPDDPGEYVDHTQNSDNNDDEDDDD